MSEESRSSVQYFGYPSEPIRGARGSPMAIVPEVDLSDR